ncbi:MAG: helix-turn-helix domain-containing protein [Ruminiclostridium sp.]|nr:helix-turn-helix domain-containing protein [Ruminiclostridium sp.]
MPKTYAISIEETEQIKKARETITNKTEDKRLYAVQLRGEGLTNGEIAARLNTSSKVISRWVCQYKRDGIKSLYQKKGIVRHCNMTFEEEEQFLLCFAQKAEKGQKVEVGDIKKAYVEKVGHSIGKGQIYEVLKRHNWRKGMPKK